MCSINLAHQSLDSVACDRGFEQPFWYRNSDFAVFRENIALWKTKSAFKIRPPKSLTGLQYDQYSRLPQPFSQRERKRCAKLGNKISECWYGLIPRCGRGLLHGGR